MNMVSAEGRDHRHSLPRRGGWLRLSLQRSRTPHRKLGDRARCHPSIARVKRQLALGMHLAQGHAMRKSSTHPLLHALRLTPFLLIAALTGGACSSDDSDSDSSATALGALCNSDADCAEGLSCDGSTEPTAGSCTTYCTGSEDCEAEFGPNAFCIGAYRCVMGCRSDGDCEANQYCNDSGWCQRGGCEADSHCWRFTCDRGSGSCREACFSDSECQYPYYCDTEYGYYECFD